MTIRFPYALLAAALLAACGSEPSGDAAARSAPDSASAAPTAERAADTVGPPPAPPQGAAVVVLAADGLGLAGGPQPGSLPFGSAQERVLAVAKGVLGEPKEQGDQEECPAGPLHYVQYADGLQLVFQDSAFVGWTAREGSPFRTGREIGSGSTLGQLRVAYPGATVQETSLGTEFDAGGLYGVLTAPSDTGTVVMMWAGTACIFR